MYFYKSHCQFSLEMYICYEVSFNLFAAGYEMLPLRCQIHCSREIR